MNKSTISLKTGLYSTSRILSVKWVKYRGHMVYIFFGIWDAFYCLWLEAQETIASDLLSVAVNLLAKATPRGKTSSCLSMETLCSCIPKNHALDYAALMIKLCKHRLCFE